MCTLLSFRSILALAKFAVGTVELEMGVALAGGEDDVDPVETKKLSSIVGNIGSDERNDGRVVEQLVAETSWPKLAADLGEASMESIMAAAFPLSSLLSFLVVEKLLSLPE